MPGAVAMIVPAMRVRGQVALLWLRAHTVLSPRVPAYRCPDLEAAVPGCAAGTGDGAGDGRSGAELLGVVCGWDRVEAHAAARKLAAVAEVYQRRPEPGCGIDGHGRMPVACAEFAAAELAAALGESRARAEDLLGSAWELAARLPGTRAALRGGTG
jgi:hypothetical protein